MTFTETLSPTSIRLPESHSPTTEHAALVADTAAVLGKGVLVESVAAALDALSGFDAMLAQATGTDEDTTTAYQPSDEAIPGWDRLLPREQSIPVPRTHVHTPETPVSIAPVPVPETVAPKHPVHVPTPSETGQIFVQVDMHQNEVTQPLASQERVQPDPEPEIYEPVPVMEAGRSRKKCYGELLGEPVIWIPDITTSGMVARREKAEYVADRLDLDLRQGKIVLLNALPGMTKRRQEVTRNRIVERQLPAMDRALAKIPRFLDGYYLPVSLPKDLPRYNTPHTDEARIFAEFFRRTLFSEDVHYPRQMDFLSKLLSQIIDATLHSTRSEHLINAKSYLNGKKQPSMQGIRL